MRNIYLFILFFAGSFSAHAQNTFGVTAGYVLSTLKDGEGRTFDSDELRGALYSLHSAYAGVFTENHFQEQLFMRYELNYTVAGGMLEAHYTNPGVSFLSRVEFHQLQFPVSINYAPIRKFSGHAGLYLAAKMATRYKFMQFRVPAFPTDFVEKFQKALAKETNANLEPFSLGVFAGVGYKTNGRFGFTARYNYTFTNMSSKRDESLRMHFLQAGISYTLVR